MYLYFTKLTCADCEKLREGSKVWSHRGGCRVYLPSPEVVQHLNDVLQRSTSFFYRNYLARLHDAEIGFRDWATKDWEANSKRRWRVFGDFTWRWWLVNSESFWNIEEQSHFRAIKMALFGCIPSTLRFFLSWQLLGGGGLLNPNLSREPTLMGSYEKKEIRKLVRKDLGNTGKKDPQKNGSQNFGEWSNLHGHGPAQHGRSLGKCRKRGGC